MNHSLETSRILRAILRHVPGTFVRDYRANRGWITVCRGEMTIYDRFKDTDKFTTGIPAETLCALPEGFVTPASLYRGVELMRPGWRIEMRRARRLMSDAQARRVEKDLGVRVFATGA